MKALDCRLDHIQGMEHEKERCSAMLATAHPSARACAVLAMPGTELYYAQCNFRFEDDDQGCFKMLQPLGYLRHAWAELARTHRLAEIHCLDPALSDHLRANPIRAGNRANLVVRASTDVDRSMSAKAKSAESRGLFDWLTRVVKRDPKDWLDNLEVILNRYRHDDFIDAAVLHNSLKETRMRLWKESVDAAEADDDARNMRAMLAFVGLGRCTTEAQEWAWLHAQCIRGAYEEVGDFEARRRLGTWVSVAESLALRAGWSLLEIPHLTAVGHVEGYAEYYFQVMEVTSTWRTWSNDPNEFPRLFFGSSGVLDAFRQLPSKAERRFEVEWGEWCEVVADPAAAETAFLSVKEATESSRSRDLLRARVRALVGLARVRILREDPRTSIDEALDALDQTLIGQGECLGHSEVCLYTAKLVRLRLMAAHECSDASAIVANYSVFQDLLSETEWLVGFNSAACKCEHARIHRLMATYMSPESPQRDEQILDALKVLGGFLDTPAPPSSKASHYFSIDCHVERLELCAMFIFGSVADSTRAALVAAAHRSHEVLDDQPEFQIIKTSLKLCRNLKGHRYSLMGRLDRLLEAWPSAANEDSLVKFKSTIVTICEDTFNERPRANEEAVVRPGESSIHATATATPANQ